MTFTDEQIAQMKEIYFAAWHDEAGAPHHNAWAIRAVAERAAQLEREACCKDICGHCKDGVRIEMDQWGKWWHPQGAPVPARGDGYEMMCSVLCESQKIRARGEGER